MSVRNISEVCAQSTEGKYKNLRRAYKSKLHFNVFDYNIIDI